MKRRRRRPGDRPPLRHRIWVVVMDKTGTLTAGAMTVTSVVLAAKVSAAEKEALRRPRRRECRS